MYEQEIVIVDESPGPEGTARVADGYSPLRVTVLPPDLVQDKHRARYRGGERDRWADDVSWRNLQDTSHGTLGSLAPYAMLTRPDACHRTPVVEVPIEVPGHRTVYTRFHGCGMTWTWGSYLELPRDGEKVLDMARWRFDDADGDPVYYCDRGACFVAAELPVELPHPEK